VNGGSSKLNKNKNCVPVTKQGGKEDVMARNTDIRLKNKRKRIFKNNVTSFLKSIRNVLVTFFLLLVAGLCTITVHHFINTKIDIEHMQQQGLYNLVQVEEGRRINVSLLGPVDAEHTIVTIADIGVQDFGVFAQKIVDTKTENTNVAVIDRAGSGFSDDTTLPQTIDQIISDYRTALTNAGVQAPYVLLSHGFGGVYATYWASQYPDEVEGIIYLDGTPMLETTAIQNKQLSTEDYIMMAAYKMGFQRMVYHNHYDHYPAGLTIMDAVCIRASNVHSVYTMAYLSEISLMGNNFNKAKESLEKTNIPKVYVSSANSFKSNGVVENYFEYKNQQLVKLGKDPIYSIDADGNGDTTEISNFIRDAQKKYKDETKPFVKLLGSCQLVNAPGDAKIYEHKLNAVLDIVKDFTKFLDGKIDCLDYYYDDEERVGWEEYEENKHQEEEQATAPSETEDAEGDVGVLDDSSGNETKPQ
jgi:hypothetical protein